MGWFWATKDNNETPDRELNPQRIPKEEKLGGIFWATPLEPSQTSGKDSRTQQPSTSSSNSSWWSSCPVKHVAQSESQCPVKYSGTGSSESKCPVDHGSFLGSSKLNPLNNMPERLSDNRAPGQTSNLPKERTMSTIPKGKDGEDGFWEYPSPQQMMNAMVRKSGTTEGIPEDAVESMVDCHNFLNEGVWQEILRWEEPYTETSHVIPRLLRFTGRPNDRSPRAEFLQMLGKIYPSKFGIPPPFDRHDWTVLRAVPGNPTEWQPVRYVIDFYELPDDGDTPAFSVDVRPALDSFQSVGDRIKHSCGPVWDKAMGRA